MCTQVGNGQVCGQAGLEVFLPPLLFWMMTQQQLALLPQPAAFCAESCRAVRLPGEVSLGLRVRWCRWLSQRLVWRSVRWLPRSCPGLDWGPMQSADRAEEPLPPGSRGRLWLWGLWPCRFQAQAVMPLPILMLAERAAVAVRCCSHCRFHWLCGHSSSSSARHRHRSAAGILGGMLAITCQLTLQRRGRAVWESVGSGAACPCACTCLLALLLLSVYFCVSGKLPTWAAGTATQRECEDMHTSL